VTAYRYPPSSLTQLPRPGVNLAYRAWIRKQPCCVSGRQWGIEAAHTGSRGLSQRADDLSCIPLYRNLHRGYDDSYHTLGKIRFEEYWGINIEREIQRLQARAVACGISLTCEPKIKRKGLGRAFGGKRRGVEGAA